MGRVGLAFRVFWRTLRDADVAERVDRVLNDDKYPAIAEKPAPAPSAPKAPAPRLPQRSEALSLLATLQREARLVDFLQESLEGFDDAQIGAAARTVHRDCGQVLKRMFGLKPVMNDAENAVVTIGADVDAGRYRLTGNVTGQPPFRGRLTHHGWEADRCDLPEWTGAAASKLVVAPAEVELA